MAQFQPGQSGNPNGRPKTDPRLKEMAQAKTEEAFAIVIECLQDEDRKVRLKAAEMILDRGYGKPAQAFTGEGGGPIQALFAWANQTSS